MTNRAPFSWIINHFTYFQTFLLICTLFFISLIPIGYFWVKTHLERITLIDEQLKELKEEKSLEVLFREIQQHRALTQRLILANDQPSRLKMKDLDQHIQSTIQNFIEKDRRKKGTISYAPSIWQKVSPQNIQERWKSLVGQMESLSHREVDPIHTSIIHDLLIQFSYLSDKVGISYFKEVENYALIEGIFLRLPLIQENISQLSLLGERYLLSKEKDLSRERIVMLLGSLQSDLSYLKFDEKLEGILHTDLVRLNLLKMLKTYRQSIEKFIKIIETHILNNPSTSLSLTDFHNFSNETISQGYQLWDEGFVNLNQIFTSERAHIVNRLWLVLMMTLILTGTAFLIGLVLTLSGTSRLSELTRATDAFTNGDMSIRVADNNLDEIGRQAQAFNRMAQKLEELITHLKELQYATQELANGNLASRIDVRKNDQEFDQVASSFNKMAETFQNIIGRLQYIGSILTASADEIAASSKKQETIILEQEKTTRDIAVTAKQISVTAKDFAQSTNQMSRVAAQTSDLAVAGKESLNNMEAIMNQLVDASGLIASKLAILNEKASNITSVITTISKVADQTNLLSLNASIEAEKAGEYGKSFAVIAREIRRLADQSAVATLDIEKIIDEMMSAVSTSVSGVDDFTQEIRKGVDQVRNASGQLAKIIKQVEDFTSRFDFLNQGMQQQSNGAEQIDKAISQLSQTAEQTSHSIRQFHKTLVELNRAASELKEKSPFH